MMKNLLKFISAYFTKLSALLVTFCFALAACDPLIMRELKAGSSTAADVMEKMGAPNRTWQRDDGGQTLEYNRQPMGVENFMIDIAPSGVMIEIRQVLTKENFAKIHAGMNVGQVRQMLGKPAKEVRYELQKELVWTWKFLNPPNETLAFNVHFDLMGNVVSTGIGPNPDSPQMRGNG